MRAIRDRVAILTICIILCGCSVPMGPAAPTAAPNPNAPITLPFGGLPSSGLFAPPTSTPYDYLAAYLQCPVQSLPVIPSALVSAGSADYVLSTCIDRARQAMELWRTALDGSGHQRITMTADNQQLQLRGRSPDGTQILYAVSNGFQRDPTNMDTVLHLANSDGSQDQVLAEGRLPPLERTVPFSPDGTQVAFVQYEQPSNAVLPTYTLWVAPTRGGAARQLVQPPPGYGIYKLAWLDATHLIYFVHLHTPHGRGDYDPQIMRISTQPTATPDLLARAWWTALNSQRTRLIVHTTEIPSALRLLSIDPRQPASLQDMSFLPEQDRLPGNFVWSPDDALLAYSVSSGDWNYTLKLVRPATGQHEEIVPSCGICIPTGWSRDGASLIYTKLGGENLTVRRWHVANRRDELLLTIPKLVDNLMFIPQDPY